MNFDLDNTPTRCPSCGDWVARIAWTSAAGTRLCALRHIDDPSAPSAAWHNHFARDVPRKFAPQIPFRPRRRRRG